MQKLNQIIFCKAALSQDTVQSAFSKLIMERDNSFNGFLSDGRLESQLL